MLYLGVDLGTSSVKLLLVDEKGGIVASVSKEYPLYFPHPGWSEQNPEDWWSAVTEGIREICKETSPSQIQGISFGGQMHGLVLLDDQDQVIRPAILWNDGRTQEECNYLNEVIGKETLSKYTANISFTGFTAPKILWVKNKEPENFARICKIMLPKDYIAYRMSGVFCTDVSDASGMLLFDVQKKTWSEEMMKICSVKREQLADIYESYEVVGTIDQSFAKEFGFSSEVKIIAGAGDNAAAAVGTGTVGDGRCNISIGTSGTIFISSKQFGVDANNALHSFAHADGTYHLMGCMLSAGSCSKWWMEDIIGTKNYKEEESGIEASGDNHVFFLPYLMGERSPHNDASARGCFVGLTLDSTRKDMTQAVLEGVAFAIRDSLEVAKSLGVTITRSNLCGGGAKSPLWTKMIANIMNLDIDLMECEEGPGYGAAILAMVGCGVYASVEEAAGKLVHVKKTVSPDPQIAQKYEARYRQFATMYPALKGVFRQINM